MIPLERTEDMIGEMAAAWIAATVLLVAFDPTGPLTGGLLGVATVGLTVAGIGLLSKHGVIDTNRQTAEG